MNRKATGILIVGLLLIGATAGAIVQLKSAIRLSAPGVKVGSQPSYDPKGGLVNSNSVPLPENIPGYEFKNLPIAFETLGWLPKDTTYGQGEYVAPDHFFVQLNVVLMGADRTSIHQPQYCLPGAGWVINEEKKVVVPMTLPHPYDLEAKRMILTAGRRLTDGTTVKAVFLYWFVADNRLSADHGTRMWTIAQDMIRSGTMQRWAYVSFFSTCLPGQEEQTFQRMIEVAQVAVPSFQIATGKPKITEARR